MDRQPEYRTVRLEQRLTGPCLAERVIDDVRGDDYVEIAGELTAVRLTPSRTVLRLVFTDGSHIDVANDDPLAALRFGWGRSS